MTGCELPTMSSRHIQQARNSLPKLLCSLTPQPPSQEAAREEEEGTEVDVAANPNPIPTPHGGAQLPDQEAIMEEDEEEELAADAAKAAAAGDIEAEELLLVEDSEGASLTSLRCCWCCVPAVARCAG